MVTVDLPDGNEDESFSDWFKMDSMVLDSQDYFLNATPFSKADAPAELNVWELNGWKLLEEGTEFVYEEKVDEDGTTTQ